jgi:hypothetical protein
LVTINDALFSLFHIFVLHLGHWAINGHPVHQNGPKLSLEHFSQVRESFCLGSKYFGKRAKGRPR